MDCMTVENGERVRVIPGESYSEMKDYKSVLASYEPYGRNKYFDLNQIINELD